MEGKKLSSIRHFVFCEFFKAALLPLLFIELALVLLYFGINAYNHDKSTETLRSESRFHLDEVVSAQSRMISEQLRAITALGHILQSETKDFFDNPEIIPLSSTDPTVFEFAPNGVYYKTNNNEGSSLFYSTAATIGPIEKKKAERSEALDSTYKYIFQANQNIVAVYLNTFDSMNRYYPFIDEVFNQFPPDMNIPVLIF